ncbi:MAG TPA: sugar-binding protein [Armatimonadota bacterium]|jgi:hypothetical protein
MPAATRLLVWLGSAVLAAALLPVAALAQEPLDLSTAGGHTWKLKDMAGDSSDLAPAAKDFKVDDTWQDADVPSNLNPALVGENTDYWLRLDGIKIPANWPKDRYLVLSGFNVDDSDVTYFNGKVIGSNTTYNEKRSYVILPDLVDFTGNNVIAIKGRNGTGGAGITDSGPVLEAGPSDSGLVMITAAKADGTPVKNVLVTTKSADGTETDRLTDAEGKVLITGVAPGAYPVQVNSYSWVGTVTPQGDLSVSVQAGKINTLALLVSPFVYTVAKAATPITIDGNITGPEWDGAMAMDVSLKRQASTGPENWTGPDDCSVVAKWKWDDTYIYLAADVNDDARVNEHVQDPTDGSMWQGDGFETYIQLDPYDAHRSSYAQDRNFQWTIGVNQNDEVSWKIFRPTPGDKVPPDIPEPGNNVKVVTKKPGGAVKAGYLIEARFPWSGLPGAKAALIPPKEGTEGAIALAVNDTDTEGSTTRETQISWNTRTDMWTNPSSYTKSIWGPVPGNTTPTGVWGDANGDGKFAIADAITALKMVAGLPVPDSTKKDLLDVDNNGKVNITDVSLMLRRLAGLIPKFPRE